MKAFRALFRDPEKKTLEELQEDLVWLKKYRVIGPLFLSLSIAFLSWALLILIRGLS